MKMKEIIIIFCVILFCIGIICVVVVGLNRKNRERQSTSDNKITENLVNNSPTNIAESNSNENNETSINTINIKVNNQTLKVKLENNSSSTAFIEKLKEEDIVVKAHDYGNFEKVGDLGFSLPTNDTRITTEPGDLILYQGDQITLYYDTNTWSFTKLGKVQNISQEELKNILGSGDVTLTFAIDE